MGKWPIHVQVSHYAGVACKRLERIGFGGKRQPRKPTTDDIDQARVSYTTELFIHVVDNKNGPPPLRPWMP